MIKLGVTGGIGSGKSTVCNIFSALGIPVYESDKQAKVLMDNSPAIKQQLLDTFGDDIYIDNSCLDRKKLASLVFNSAPLLQKLNNIVHPEVRKDFLAWATVQQSPYVIQESAILFDSGFHQIMDATLSVTAPIEDRIARVMKRDHCSKEDVMSRIKNQMTDEQRVKLSDYIIDNSDNSMVLTQVIKLDKKLRHG